MSSWSDATFANLPIGQGEAMTVLQLASMYQTIANDGVRVPPRIVESVTRSDGSSATEASPAVSRVVSARPRRTVRTMLESVTLPGGTGVKAAIPGYRIAGKTGTAQQPDPARGGAYIDWMNWDTFAGIAPADNPQFVVAIMIDNPAHGLRGRRRRRAAVQPDRRLLQLQHAHIPPTGSQSEARAAARCCDAVTREPVRQYRVLTCRSPLTAPPARCPGRSRGRASTSPRARSPGSSAPRSSGRGRRRRPASRPAGSSSRPGDLFAALSGRIGHGAQFAPDALRGRRASPCSPTRPARR